MEAIKSMNGLNIGDHIYMTNTDGTTNTNQKFIITGFRVNSKSWLLAKPLYGGKTLEFQNGEFAQVVYL